MDESNHLQIFIVGENGKLTLMTRWIYGLLARK